MSTHSLPPCPLCGEPEALAELASDGERGYLACARCDLVFMRPESHLAPEAEKRRYDLHRNDPSDPDYRQFLAQLAGPLAGVVPAGARGLDFGCGPTAVLALMLEEAGLRMSRYDPFYAPDRSALEAPYDVIACSEAAEHFFYPAREWALLLGLVKPGGWLGIMTRLRDPQADFIGWWYRKDTTHVSFYSRRTFEWLAAQHGLEATFFGKSVVLLRKPE